MLGGRDESRLSAEPEPAARAPSDRPSIAILPLDNFSPNPGDAYFANSLHDELTSTLAQISALRVTARTSVERYRENRPSATEIASELGVDYLIEGSALFGVAKSASRFS